MNYAEIVAVSNDFKTTPIKGKDYVQVNERVKAFRKLIPEGSIVTDIISMSSDSVCIKATILSVDGRVLATGLASEDKAASMINKTSYIENCETSAVGRALGFMGIGIDASICSAEELEHSLEYQDHIEKNEKAKPKKAEPKRTPKEEPKEEPEDAPVTKIMIETLKKTMERKGVTNEMVLTRMKVRKFEELKTSQFASVMRMLDKTPDKPQEDLGF